MRPGTFEATVKQTFYQESNKKGTPGFRVTVQVHDPEDPEWTMDGDIWLSDISDDAKRMGRKSMKAIGWPIDTRSLDELAAAPQALLGQRCRVVIEEETYNDESRLKIRYFNPLGKPGDVSKLGKLTEALRSVKSKEEPEVEDKLGEIDAKFSGKEKAATGDDIPF